MNGAHRKAEEAAEKAAEKADFTLTEMMRARTVDSLRVKAAIKALQRAVAGVPGTYKTLVGPLGREAYAWVRTPAMGFLRLSMRETPARTRVVDLVVTTPRYVIQDSIRFEVDGKGRIVKPPKLVDLGSLETRKDHVRRAFTRGVVWPAVCSVFAVSKKDRAAFEADWNARVSRWLSPAIFTSSSSFAAARYELWKLFSDAKLGTNGGIVDTRKILEMVLETIDAPSRALRIRPGTPAWFTLSKLLLLERGRMDRAYATL